MNKNSSKTYKRNSSLAKLTRMMQGKGGVQRGDSVGLIVGGIEEILEGTFNDKDVLYLKNRKGFVKVAMDQNAGLVPVYAFGENQLFHTSTLLLEFRRRIAQYARVGVPLMSGRFGVPFGLLGPIPTHVTMVIGREVETGSPNSKPTDAEVP